MCASDVWRRGQARSERGRGDGDGSLSARRASAYHEGRDDLLHLGAGSLTLEARVLGGDELGGGGELLDRRRQRHPFPDQVGLVVVRLLPRVLLRLERNLGSP